MSEPDPPDDFSDDNKVGYGRPPISTRFKPGKSGNPRGRPKGVKSIGTLLEEALARRVTVHESGRDRKMRTQDIIIQGLVNDAARRNPQAVKLLFALMERYGQSGEALIDPASLQADDQAIIESYFASVHPPSQADAARDSATPAESPTTRRQPPQQG
jgi:Family of unknown function (DUF5681)